MHFRVLEKALSEFIHTTEKETSRKNFLHLIKSFGIKKNMQNVKALDKLTLKFEKSGSIASLYIGVTDVALRYQSDLIQVNKLIFGH